MTPTPQIKLWTDPTFAVDGPGWKQARYLHGNEVTKGMEEGQWPEFEPSIEYLCIDHEELLWRVGWAAPKALRLGAREYMKEISQKVREVYPDHKLSYYGVPFLPLNVLNSSGKSVPLHTADKFVQEAVVEHVMEWQAPIVECLDWISPSCYSFIKGPDTSILRQAELQRNICLLHTASLVALGRPVVPNLWPSLADHDGVHRKWMSTANWFRSQVQPCLGMTGGNMLLFNDRSQPVKGACWDIPPSSKFAFAVQQEQRHLIETDLGTFIDWEEADTELLVKLYRQKYGRYTAMVAGQATRSLLAAAEASLNRQLRSMTG